MVEIKHSPGKEPSIQHEEDMKYSLLYAKSKVYVHPTAYARDNIPGFVTIVRKVSIRALKSLYEFNV